MSDEERLVDARGMLCPWPVLRLGRAARESGASPRICLIADDPSAGRELEQLCAQRGWSFARDPLREDMFHVVIGPAVNSIFTSSS